MNERSLLRTPVAFFIFNRPDCTKVVFEQIRKARPATLAIIADGPRRNYPMDKQLCQETRGITEAVDWPCVVVRNYVECNLGCRKRVSSGLAWVFSKFESAIILEDDCVPNQSFFPYCEELLARYWNEKLIMHISGDNFHSGLLHGTASYFLSKYTHIWGWATWRRAWANYDEAMKAWRKLRRSSWLRTKTGSELALAYWYRIFDCVYTGEIDTWDYQWQFTCWLHGGNAIVPNVNLISNIGFGGSATHGATNSIFANLPTREIQFPLQHPAELRAQEEADLRTEAKNFSGSLPTVNSKRRGFIQLRRFAQLLRRLLKKAQSIGK